MQRKKRSFLSHAYADELIRGGGAHVTSRPYLRSTQAYYFRAYACNGSDAEERVLGGPWGPETGREPRARGYEGPHSNSGNATAKTEGFGKARPENKLSSEMPGRGFEEGVVLLFSLRPLSMCVCVCVCVCHTGKRTCGARFWCGSRYDWVLHAALHMFVVRLVLFHDLILFWMNFLLLLKVGIFFTMNWFFFYFCFE